MLARLLFLFITVPLVELALLLLLAQYTYWWVSLSLVILTGLIGATLARQQGLSTLARVQQELGRGRMPTDALVDGLLIFFAGGLLLTPGVLTDVLGITLLIPQCRTLYKRLLGRWFRAHYQFTTVHSQAAQRTEIIDSYVVPRSDVSASDVPRSDVSGSDGDDDGGKD